MKTTDGTHIHEEPPHTFSPNGNLHVVYSLQDRRQTVFHGELYYGTDGSGTFQVQRIDYRPHQAQDTRFREPVIRIHPQTGRPMIACQFVHSHVPGGSWISSALYFTDRNANGSWSPAILASSSDGYRGNDGDRYTAGLLKMEIMPWGEPLIVFTDIASYHDENGHNRAATGQIRIARRSGSAWPINKLYSQTAPATVHSTSIVDQVGFLEIVSHPESDTWGVIAVQVYSELDKATWGAQSGHRADASNDLLQGGVLVRYLLAKAALRVSFATRSA